MATWKRFFTTPSVNHQSSGAGGGGGYSIQASGGDLSDAFKGFYTGSMNRLERYNQYDQLDRDPTVHAALNVLAEFCTQENKFTNLPFVINFEDTSVDTEVTVLNDALKKWAYLNDFRVRMFYIARNTFKYGDTFFVRDPETYEWFYVDPRDVEKIVVDELKGNKIHSYFIRNVSPNLQNKIFTSNKSSLQAPRNTINDGLTPTAPNTQASVNGPGQGHAVEIMANHVIHLSLNSTGLDQLNWPFAASMLDSIYKSAKQKELLENAYLIYKVQRAPERRAFYIYTGDQPSHKAMQHVERVKYEMHQKRIPSRNGQASVLDATYDPQNLLEDFYFPVNSEGQGPRVEMLPGGDGLSSGMDDMLYFNSFILGGLGIPKSYISMAAEDPQIAYNDGKLGVALLQEWRFAQQCQRLQLLIRDAFDFEFKLFAKFKGIIINSSEYSLEFEEPQSFADYRQMEKDQTALNVLNQAIGMPFMSKRFVLKRYGGLTEEEILENERMYKEENPGKFKDTVADIELNDIEDISLNNIGIKKPTEDDIDDNDDGDIPDET